MATEFELAVFEQELLELQNLPEAARWNIERDTAAPLGLFATMHPRSKPDETYLARLRWDILFGPVSLKFQTLDTRSENDPRAWPKCRGFRPGNLDACVSWTKEGHALHPEWCNSTKASYSLPDKPVQFAVLMVQHELDAHYGGRGP